MESDDVAALKVFNTGDNAMRARKTKIDDLSVLEPIRQQSVSGMPLVLKYVRRFVFRCTLLE
jgi:hypothetical protein